MWIFFVQDYFHSKSTINSNSIPTTAARLYFFLPSIYIFKKIQCWIRPGAAHKKFISCDTFIQFKWGAAERTLSAGFLDSFFPWYWNLSIAINLLPPRRPYKIIFRERFLPDINACLLEREEKAVTGGTLRFFHHNGWGVSYFRAFFSAAVKMSCRTSIFLDLKLRKFYIRPNLYKTRIVIYEFLRSRHWYL